MHIYINKEMKVFNSVIIFIYFNLKRIIDYNQFWIRSIIDLIDFAEWSIMPITNLSSNNFKMFHFGLILIIIQIYILNGRYRNTKNRLY